MIYSDDPKLFDVYLELRGTLDHDTVDATIIVSTVGEFYVTINGEEFKL